jgi:hypothetical protein
MPIDTAIFSEKHGSCMSHRCNDAGPKPHAGRVLLLVHSTIIKLVLYTVVIDAMGCLRHTTWSVDALCSVGAIHGTAVFQERALRGIL